MIVYIYRILDV